MRRVRDFEEGLISSYKSYLDILEQTIQGIHPYELWIILLCHVLVVISEKLSSLILQILLNIISSIFNSFASLSNPFVVTKNTNFMVKELVDSMPVNTFKLVCQSTHDVGFWV